MEIKWKKQEKWNLAGIMQKSFIFRIYLISWEIEKKIYYIYEKIGQYINKNIDRVKKDWWN